MVTDEIKRVLNEHVNKPGQGVPKLAREAGVVYETARRAIHGIGDASLVTTNALLVAAGHELQVIKKETQ
ncbi:hypothetical protein [Deinococcus sp. Leaf326]|uniref:hypothetical protein n=1 Tax=Deinococcus sp. Leaf326 TaxID=1736338 RepID=UPI0006F61FDD|nr:hypothetical protein [Deinococcus sp. Leaf326]KQR22916.1 hypothetical protein ASF71_07040 [Deinococcus sp. Leaf326]